MKELHSCCYGSARYPPRCDWRWFAKTGTLQSTRAAVLLAHSRTQGVGMVLTMLFYAQVLRLDPGASGTNSKPAMA